MTLRVLLPGAVAGIALAVPLWGFGASRAEAEPHMPPPHAVAVPKVPATSLAGAARPEAARSGTPVSGPQAAPEPSKRESPAAIRNFREAPSGLPADDYYARRAKALVEKDEASFTRQRSLDNAYPDHNVVVCEAGCYGTSRRVVQFAAKARPVQAGGARLAPTAGSTAESPAAKPAPGEASIDCVAGCYDQKRSYRAASADAALQLVHAELALNTRQTVAASEPGAAAAERTPARRGEVGPAATRWMTTSGKADQPTAKSAVAGPSAKASVGRAAKTDKASGPGRRTTVYVHRRKRTTTGEWFVRIEADRAAD